MFANKIMVWPFKQSPKVHYAVLCTNTSCKWKKLDLGTLDNLLRFFKEEKIISAQSTLFICKKQKNKYKKRKVMLYYPFMNFFEAVYGIL